ncbi:MAG: putative lysozyme precursor [Frankiales bacterium]|nr:putative lysozyme precursor [Frankiales bacterium]
MLRRTVLLLAVAGTVLTTPAAMAAVSGPDVSHYQHPGGAGIGWTVVRASGHSFVLHKATDGAAQTDATFSRDWRDATSAGLVVGGYHYARPSAAAGNAAAQARHFVGVLGTTRHTGQLPPLLDLESSGGLTPSQLITWTRTFLSTVHALTGRTPVIYSYPYFWKTAMAGTTAFHGYPLWGACYCSSPTNFAGAWSHWTFWQYSDHSTVQGIVGKTDMNRFNGTLAQLKLLSNGFPTAEPVVTLPSGVARVGTDLTLTAPTTALPGQPLRITGTLLTKGGHPVAGRTVVVSRRAVGTSGWSQVATLTTSSTGAWGAQLRATADVELVAQFAGDAGALTSSSPVQTLDVTYAAG